MGGSERTSAVADDDPEIDDDIDEATQDNWDTELEAFARDLWRAHGPRKVTSGTPKLVPREEPDWLQNVERVRD